MAELLGSDFTSKFKKRVASAREVWICSAWMTESQALNALVSRKRECAVRVIVGIRGNATSPDSLYRLAQEFGWERVRIADPPDRLFHAKLFLFHYPRRPTVAWIGSANFTGHGMEVNRELMLETSHSSAVTAMQKWFDKEWEDCCPDTEAVAAAYRQRWTPPNEFNGDWGGEPAPVGPRPRTGPDRRSLVDLREKPDNGKCYKFKYFGEDRWAKSLAEIARNVLVAFGDADPDFLTRFATKDDEARTALPSATRRYLSKRRGELGTQPPKGGLPKPHGQWRMAQRLEEHLFFQGKSRPGILKMACEAMDVTYGEGDAGPIDFQSTQRSKPPGFAEGEVILVKIGTRSERHRLDS